MLAKIIIAGACFLSVATAAAVEQLTVDQINKYKIAREIMREERESSERFLIYNELTIEILLRWADGENISTFKNRVLPAAGAATTGAGAQFWVMKKGLPAFLQRLPAVAQTWLRRSPALAGLVAAYFAGNDIYDYSSAVKSIQRLPRDREAIEREYDLLLLNREHFLEQIQYLSLEINKIDKALQLYE